MKKTAYFNLHDNSDFQIGLLVKIPPTNQGHQRTKNLLTVYCQQQTTDYNWYIFTYKQNILCFPKYSNVWNRLSFMKILTIEIDQLWKIKMAKVLFEGISWKLNKFYDHFQ